jgi:hypothetical protein
MKSSPLSIRPSGFDTSSFYKIIGLFILHFFLLAPQVKGATHKTSSSELRNLTEQETWTLGQVKQGKEADLKKRVAGKKQNYSLDAEFLKALITGALNNIQISNQGVKITNATIEGDLDLDNVEITYPVVLKHCKFMGQVTLKRSYFKKDLSFEGSEFSKSADFSGMKTEGYFTCDGARFREEALWCDAKIGLEFQARRAEFYNNEKLVDFNSLRVGDSIHLGEAIFHGPVSFIRASIGQQLLAHEAKFLAREPKVPSKEKLVTFRGITTGNSIFLIKTEFNGPVEFRLAEIGMDLNATGAKFVNEKQPKDFSYMKVVQKVILDDNILRGDFDFSYGIFNDFEIHGVQKVEKNGCNRDIVIHSLNLKGVQVKRNLNISNVNIDKLNMNQIKVSDVAAFENMQVNKSADFRGGSFKTLDFQSIHWPEVNRQQQQESAKVPGKGKAKRFRYEVYLGDITFGSFSIDKPECDANADPCDSEYTDGDFKRILEFVDDCPFYTQSYLQVETFFKHIGRDYWANKAFMRMHNRELSEKMQWYDPRRWLEWFFWGKIAGYGRAPFRVFFLSLAFIILGAYLFNPTYLKEHKISHDGRLYKSLFIRFFISLDRFLPIDMGLAKDWEAQGRHFSLWLYYFLHRVLGWILIPIALASIYSQLK